MKSLNRSTGPMDWAMFQQRLRDATEALGMSAGISPQRAQAIMDERARALARIPPAPPPASEVLEVLIFGVAEQWYAIQTDYVRAVMFPCDITPLPRAPDFLRGMANLRGEVLAVMDLSRLLEFADADPAEPSWVVVLGTQRTEFGLLAHTVHEVSRLRVEQLLDPSTSAVGVQREYLRGVTRDALLLLDGAALLRDPRLWIDQDESSEPV